MYLFDAAFGSAEHVDHVTWDEDHWRQSHKPSNHLTPQRIHILPQRQGRHFKGTEGKDPLEKTKLLVDVTLIIIVISHC